MATGEEAEQPNKAFQKGYWSEEDEADDDFFPEEDDDIPESIRKKRLQYQKEVGEAGMLEVRSQDDWKKAVVEKLREAKSDFSEAKVDIICDRIEQAGKATCRVSRSVNSPERITFHKDQMEKYDEEKNEIWKYHKEKLKRAEDGKGGCGTGFLISPKNEHGWLVITNNHVIMNEKEAKGAIVVFDYLVDFSTEGSCRFEVSGVLSKSDRTRHADDFDSLDFSLLTLQVEPDQDKYLLDRALRFEKIGSTMAALTPFIQVLQGIEFSPIIGFSHPHGLAKRLSISKYDPTSNDYPVAHIQHDLPTFSGSSGANLLLPNLDDNVFMQWRAAFLHYRSKKAVSWKAIADHLQEYSI